MRSEPGAPAAQLAHPPAVARRALHPGRRRSRGSSARRAALGLLVALVLALGVLGWWVHRALYASPGPAVRVVVRRGDSLESILPQLLRSRVVRAPELFVLWVHLHAPPVLRPGVYLLRRHEGYAAVLATLDAAPSNTSLAIPPGLTLAQVAARVGALPGRSAAGFLSATRSVRSPFEPAGSKSLEGLLGAATYTILPGESDAELVRQMVASFDTSVARLGLTPSHPGAYDLVIEASLVEREARLPGDFPKVARVIDNRLSAHMPLQLDATVVYALGGTTAPLTGADLRLASPYNTYRHRGLPPTPIAVPSARAVEAVLHPVPGAWLYYVVVRSDGAEAFSSTYAGQLRNIALARSRGLAG